MPAFVENYTSAAIYTALGQDSLPRTDIYKKPRAGERQTQAIEDRYLHAGQSFSAGKKESHERAPGGKIASVEHGLGSASGGSVVE